LAFSSHHAFEPTRLPPTPPNFKLTLSILFHGQTDSWICGVNSKASVDTVADFLVQVGDQITARTLSRELKVSYG
jgi:hypothetical protein